MSVFTYYMPHYVHNEIMANLGDVLLDRYVKWSNFFFFFSIEI